MKPFSVIKNEGSKKEKVLISFYQFKDNMAKNNVPTNSVCSEDFFYDEDGKIENQLAEKEGKWASAIKKINCGDTLTASEISDILNLVKDILPLITDLEIGILENKTEVSFFTSDVPVIIINSLSIHRAGLGDIGTVIFFPVSPKKMIMFYDSKLYGRIPEEIQDLECVHAFNKYQYIGADERILASNSVEFESFIQNEELNSIREKFPISIKTNTIYDGVRTFMATKSRSIGYYINIPILKLPKSLKKIPADFRETFSRGYSFDTRMAILCRIYREPDFIKEEKLKEHWRKSQKYAKKLLNYLDYYWNTPREECVISGEFMRQLKTVPVSSFFQQKKGN